MMLAAWLGTIAWPLVSRVLVALGFAFVTYEGVGLALNGALAAAKAAWAGLPLEIAQILAIAGAPDALSIISGGLVGGVAFMQLKRLVPR